MKGNKDVKISYFAAHFTTIISVTLVLVTVGVIALLGAGARRETKELKESVELNIIMADSVSDAGAGELLLKLNKMPYVRSSRLITKDEALKNWTADTGENLEELFGVNPLSPEISFTLCEEYSSPQAINNISKDLRKIAGVEDVAVPDTDMVRTMNRNIEGLTLVLGIVAIALIVISFVLINNTVHLTVYSRRFTIHTMQLVGATNGFIRRPFILNNMLSGVIAGAVASALLACALWYLHNSPVAAMAVFFDWTTAGIVFGGLVVAGALICAISAWIATSRYLRKDYDDLFR